MIAVVTGIAGQDGSYLAELLTEKNYKVIGITRRKSVSSSASLGNLSKVLTHKNFKLLYGDITDTTFISRILYDYKPHEYYNLAAMSHVGHSFQEPEYTFKVNAEAVIKQLELIRQISPYTRFYQASTSELFGGLKCPEEGYTEDSPFHPRSPYAVSKLAAFWATKNYREAYGLYACSGILHNHCSPRRGLDFATRKITFGAANVVIQKQRTVRMGNLEAFRDEGHARDYVKAMHMMLSQDNPDDFLIATGSGATIKEMFQYVCGLADLDFDQVYEKDPMFMRPSDVPFLKGDFSKAKSVLGWEPQYTWRETLKEMYESDLHSLVSL